MKLPATWSRVTARGVPVTQYDSLGSGAATIDRVAVTTDVSATVPGTSTLGPSTPNPGSYVGLNDATGGRPMTRPLTRAVYSVGSFMNKTLRIIQ